MHCSPATLVSTDSRLILLAQASAAASGGSLSVVSHAGDLRAQWRTSSAILIGADSIEEVMRWAMPRRDQVYLLGFEESREVLCRWSVPLGASVIQLPDGGKWLSRVIAGHTRDLETGTVVAVRGGCGGVGASTLCAGLAVAGLAKSLTVALVDADPYGGGLDLLMGAENIPGWRWDKLRKAVGQIADVTSMLPKAEGVTLVSMERGSCEPVPEPALEAVIDCLARSHDLVLIDSGRATGDLQSVKRSVILSAQTVRALASTKVIVNSMNLRDSALVVRKGGSVGSRDAARALDLPLIGMLPNVSELPRLADRGIPPSLGGAWKKSCSQILQWCLGEAVSVRGI